MINAIRHRDLDDSSKFDQMADWEKELRTKLAAAYRLASMYGWDEVIYNHISVRHPEQRELFLLNPWGLHFTEIKASDLVWVDSDGNLRQESKLGINPAGFIIHSAVHDARADINCVLHHHSVAGSAVAAQEKGLLPITTQSIRYMPRVAYHPYEGLSFYEGEKERIQAALGEKKQILFLRNHGVLTCGRTIEEAFMIAYWIEKACKIQVDACAGGRALHFPSQDSQDRTVKQIEDGMGWPEGEREFSALMRLLDATDPSYRN